MFIDEFDAVTYSIELMPQLPRENVDDFGRDGRPSDGDMARFWMGWKSWLAARGVKLTIGIKVPETRSEFCMIWSVPSFVAGAGLPYADCVRREPLRVEGNMPEARIAWAQDAMCRDIVLKLTNTWSDEYHIYHRLLNLANTHAPTECLGVLLPVAILNTPHDFAFVIMPRWGEAGGASKLRSVGEAIQFMRCTSKGLRLLHENRIDVDESNMLMSAYCPDIRLPEERDEFRAQRRRTADIHYCLFDFNIGLRFPFDTSLATCRRPSDEGFDGSPCYHPIDVALGEHEYNPFAYDVGCLGNLYRANFSKLVSAVPSLALLFDKMTTHVVSQRFTAFEAAEFIDSVYSQTSEETLSTPLTLAPEWACYLDTDVYWSRVPRELLLRWEQYRTPKIPWQTLVLNRLTDLPIGWRIIRFVRRTLRI